MPPTSLYITKEISARIDALAAREGRKKVAILQQMIEIYEPLHPYDRVILTDTREDLCLDTDGQALSYIIQSWRQLQIDVAALRRHVATLQEPTRS